MLDGDIYEISISNNLISSLSQYGFIHSNQQTIIDYFTSEKSILDFDDYRLQEKE